AADHAAPDGSAAALRAAIDEAAAAPDENVKPYVPAPCVSEYAKAQGNFNATFGLPAITEQMLRIVRAEGPVAEDLLFARVLEEWGFKQISDNRLKVLRKAVPKTLLSTVHLKRRTYWPAGADPAEWRTCRVPGDDPRSRRTFAQIPFEEFAAAFDSLSRSAPGLFSSGDADAPLRAAMETFGLPPRLSADARQFLEAALRASKSFAKDQK
ncbi:MAG: DUF3320 domain-containing protein, partial [Kiritimatiellae bacterium]|nr:DUF3320 domain-containing protein [Kiritimatiellia bacterium]